jgi:phage shock protein PspC (stress-responsive transcriptional regulator)
MNKTIIININGIVFHIEEDAYEILKNYMTDVKRHFSNSADSLEITTDIENRIAEMFAELLEKESRQVIVDQDVTSVTEQMGSVADFENAENNSESNSYPFNNREGRRLFRDPDDHLVAGVCAGVANYFDINPVWIRLAFAIAVAFAGTGFILYVILWIVVPKAITRADRMAMKGEKQNLQGFKKNLEEELSSVRQNLHNLGYEAKPFVYKARDFAGDFFHHLGIFMGEAGKILIKLIGVALLLACFAGIVALIIGLITVFFLGRDLDMFPFRIIKSEYADNVYLAAFLAAFIPLLSIILLIFKGIFNTGSIGKTTGTVFLAIWLCALSMVIYYAIKISSQFRESASFTETVAIKATKNNTYYLKLNDIKYFSHEDSVRLNIKDHFKNMIVTDDDYNGFHNEPNSVSIQIEKSDVSRPELVERYSAQGANYESALFNARNTTYVFAQQDSVLKFDYTLRKTPNRSWHAEEVVLTLRVPMNAKVVIEQKLDNYVRDINLYQCKQDNKQPNSNTATFIMTDNGLQCKVDTLVTAKKDSAKVDSAGR